MDLLNSQSHGGGDLGHRYAALPPRQDRVEQGERDAKEELLLAAASAVGVGGGRALADRLRHPQSFRKLVHLGLEEMLNRAQVSAPVTEFDEEAQIVLILVGRPHDGVVSALRVVI